MKLEINNKMNPDNGTIETVAAHVAPSQLMQYLASLDERIQEEKNREINEQFRNVRCFKNILGTSTTFKLFYDKSFFSKEKILIEPKNWGSVPIKLWQSSVPKTMAMSLHSENESAFLTYVSNLNQVTVFCPEVQQPIGRIVRRENTNGADMICLATNKSFTMTFTQSHMPASMRITDSQGRVVGAGGVTAWKTISKYSTTTYLKQFQLELENGLSEPTRVLLLVTFANWAMWVNDGIRNGNRMKNIIGLCVSAAILLVFVFSHLFYYYGN